jgi:hypothetical protein
MHIRRPWAEGAPSADRLVTALEHECDAASAQVACLNGPVEGSADSRGAGTHVP